MTTGLFQTLLVILGLLFWLNIVLILRQAFAQLIPETERFKSLLLALCCVITVLLATFPDRKIAGEFLVSDSVEYALSARELAQHGQYALPFSERGQLPPRYPIWFSLVCLSPFSALSDDPRIGIFAVTAFVAVSAFSAFTLGAAVAGSAAGVLSALILIGIPGFRYFSQSIISDIATTALLQMLALLYLCTLKDSSARHLTFLRIGTVAALACGFRLTALLIFIPFLVISLPKITAIRQRLLASISLFAPLLAITVFNALYNLATFGHIARTGYHYWTALPYDFFDLTFSFGFIAQNITPVLIESGILPILAIIVFTRNLSKKLPLNPQHTQLRSLRDLERFTFLIGLPLCALFLCYFYATLRFYLPITALLAGVMVGGLSALLNDFYHARLPYYALAISFSLACLFAFVRQPLTPISQSAIDLASLCTPQTAVVSATNPLLLEQLLAGSCGEIIPSSRAVEFASKATLIESANASHEKRTTRDFSLSHGGLDVYKRVAQEMPRIAADTLIDISLMPQDEIEWFNSNYRLAATSAAGIFLVKEQKSN